MMMISLSDPYLRSETLSAMLPPEENLCYNYFFYYYYFFPIHLEQHKQGYYVYETLHSLVEYTLYLKEVPLFI